MSSVRMCDKCKTVFSELDDGWQTYEATTIIYDDDGKPQTIHQRMDACPDCASVPVKRKKSEIEKRIEQLERENKQLDRAIAAATKGDTAA
jgi:hypothetical protein